MNLTKFAKEVHENAVAHGWWEEERPFPEIIALCHSELSEALEEYRSDKPEFYLVVSDPDRAEFLTDVVGVPAEYRPEKPDRIKIIPKPEGVATELADCIIRILDWCGKNDIDIERIMQKKHEYNKTRPYRHGGKKA